MKWKFVKSSWWQNKRLFSSFRNSNGRKADEFVVRIVCVMKMVRNPSTKKCSRVGSLFVCERSPARLCNSEPVVFLGLLSHPKPNPQGRTAARGIRNPLEYFESCLGQVANTEPETPILDQTKAYGGTRNVKTFTGPKPVRFFLMALSTGFLFVMGLFLIISVYFAVTCRPWSLRTHESCKLVKMNPPWTAAW